MITTKTAEELWDFVLQTLKPELKDETFDLWLKPLFFSRDEKGIFVLRVPNRFFFRLGEDPLSEKDRRTPVSVHRSAGALEV